MENYKLASSLNITENGFLFAPTSGESYTVNELGSFIISQIQDYIDSQEIISSIISEFEIDANSVEKDFNDFINQLANLRLVVKS